LLAAARLFGGFFLSGLFRRGLLGSALLFACLLAGFLRGRRCRHNAHRFRVHSTSSSARTNVADDVRRARGDASLHASYKELGICATRLTWRAVTMRSADPIFCLGLDGPS